MPVRFPISTPVKAILALVLFHASMSFGAPKKSAAKPIKQTESSLPSAAASSKPRPMVDTSTIRKLYLDGDFDQAIVILETGIKEKRPFNHADSVFIFKHLGVMYAAKYDTREKGKYYMHQLLMTEPTAKIMDMYASDMIYMIFKNIQDEFESSRTKYDRAETHVVENGRVNQESGKDERSGKNDAQPSKGGHAAFYWVGGGALVVGTAAYFLLQGEPKTTTTTNKHTVP